MSNEAELQALYDRIAALRETATNRLGSDLIQNPQLANALTKQIDDLLASVVNADLRRACPARQAPGSASWYWPRGCQC